MEVILAWLAAIVRVYLLHAWAKNESSENEREREWSRTGRLRSSGSRSCLDNYPWLDRGRRRRRSRRREWK